MWCRSLSDYRLFVRQVDRHAWTHAATSAIAVTPALPVRTQTEPGPVPNLGSGSHQALAGSEQAGRP